MEKKNELQGLREEIDWLDQELLSLLAKRFEITRRVGEYKKINSLPPLSLERETEIFRNCADSAEKLGLNPEMITKIFRIIIEEVKVNHKKIAEFISSNEK